MSVSLMSASVWQAVCLYLCLCVSLFVSVCPCLCVCLCGKSRQRRAQTMVSQFKVQSLEFEVWSLVQGLSVSVCDFSHVASHPIFVLGFSHHVNMIQSGA